MNKKAMTVTRLMTLILAGIVAVEIVCLVYFNLITDYSCDDDAAKLMYHTIKMWEGRSLILPNWSYMTTGEWDCSSFPAMFLYGIIGDIFRSYAIANCINIVLLVVVINALMRCVNASMRSICIALAVILLPYSFGILCYTNMLFYSGAQYIYKVMTPLTLLLLLHRRCRTGRKSGRILWFGLWILTELLVFLTTSSSGLYVLGCGLVPIAICRISWMLLQRRWPDRQESLVAGSTMIIALVAWYFHRHAGIPSNADEMTLQTASSIIEAFHENIRSSLGIMGVLPSESTAVVSAEGMLSLIKCAVVFLLLLLTVPNFKRFLCLDRWIPGRSNGGTVRRMPMGMVSCCWEN